MPPIHRGASAPLLLIAAAGFFQRAAFVAGQAGFPLAPDLVQDLVDALIEVHLVASDAGPGGVGEPGVPPLAPAVANAVAALTGKPVRKLPIRV